MKLPRTDILGGMVYMSRAWRLAALALLLIVALWPSASFAHGETITTDPEGGAALRRPPKSVSVSLTEPPAKNARFRVVDGCGRAVSGAAQVEGSTLSTSISGGEPGRWKASYRAISSVDGHLTRDTFAFKVAGKKDCSRDEPKEPGGNGGNGNGGGEGDGGGGTARGPGDEDDGSSFPVVPVAAGTVALVGLALVIRTRSAH